MGDKTTEALNEDLEDENLDKEEAEYDFIPENLQITQELMKERKYMDPRRWLCMARPQHPKSCGISSLTSVWNYLFSTLGCGSK